MAFPRVRYRKAWLRLIYKEKPFTRPPTVEFSVSINAANLSPKDRFRYRGSIHIQWDKKPLTAAERNQAFRRTLRKFCEELFDEQE